MIHRIGIRIDNETVERIKTLQGVDRSLSEVVREAISFYYDYMQGLACLFAEEDEED